MIKSYFKKRRIRYYKELLDETPLNAIDEGRIVNDLHSIWSVIRPDDIHYISEIRQGLIDVSVWTTNCYNMVHLLKEINKCIISDNERGVDTLICNLKERKLITLDMFLTNSRNQIIDSRQVIIRLKGLIEEHHHVLKSIEGKYYQRLCAKLYQDIVTFTNIHIAEAYTQTQSGSARQ